jgi:glycine cleavage system transcriptional repressor
MSTQNKQLIVNILGMDQAGILCKITSVVRQENCNILDSRLAIYGEDFSLTMIIEGSMPAITKAELSIGQECRDCDLLCLMKQTKRHAKQNLAFLIDIEFAGIDTPGIMQAITKMLGKHDASINALRQTTFQEKNAQIDMLKCNMVASLPSEEIFKIVGKDFNALVEELDLIGNISQH